MPPTHLCRRRAPRHCQLRAIRAHWRPRRSSHRGLARNRDGPSQVADHIGDLPNGWDLNYYRIRLQGPTSTPPQRHSAGRQVSEVTSWCPRCLHAYPHTYPCQLTMPPPPHRRLCLPCSAGSSLSSTPRSETTATSLPRFRRRQLVSYGETERTGGLWQVNTRRARQATRPGRSELSGGRRRVGSDRPRGRGAA